MSTKIESLFLAYLEGTISKDEEIYLLEWLKNNPDSLKSFHDFKRLWNMTQMAGTLSRRALEAEWKQLLQKIEASEHKTIFNPGRILFWLPRIAAVFLLGALLSFFVSYLIFGRSGQDITFQEINTPAGAKSQVTLPDGTNIWLNAGSSIKYSSEFGLKDRKVELTGEAFFDVTKNPSKVFVVKTSELDIKAYGTAFNVKSYPDEGTIEATLIEGKIGIARNSGEQKLKDEVMLEPDQRVVYYRKTQSAEPAAENRSGMAEPGGINRAEKKLTYLVSKGIDTKQFTSWKDGTLFITSETLQALAVKLERKYDVKIHFVDEDLKNLKFTGSLEDETVEQVIEAIGIAAHIDYEIEDRDIWLKNQNK